MLLWWFWAHVVLITQEAPEFRFSGLKMYVNDLSQAETFYKDVLGFSLQRTGDQWVVNTGTWPIYLSAGIEQQPPSYPTTARTGLTVQTYRLLPRIDRLREMGVPVLDSLLRRNGVGISIPFSDPTGNVLNMMEVQARELPQFAGIKVYNSGVTISDMVAARNFYQEILGFESWSERYLPDALPLKHKDGSFAFMVHYKPSLLRNETAHGVSPGVHLILSTPDLERARDYLKSKEVIVQQKGPLLICKDPEGNILEVIVE